MKYSHSLLLLLLVSACMGTPQRGQTRGNGPATEPPRQEVIVYRACDSAEPGALMPLRREVPADLDPVAAAIGELLRGVNDEERARGCSSFFSPRTADALRSVERSEGGDTVLVDFRDFSPAIPDAPGATSFAPPGVMAELTWTIFQQFPDIDAVHFSFDGDERAFWTWLGDEATEPQAFTRRMWEEV